MMNTPVLPSERHFVLKNMVSDRGATFEEISAAAPVLLVFLRHLGCTFCRETLSDLREARAELEAAGVTIALVHMTTDGEAFRVFLRYGLQDLHRFSDPGKRLYRAFGLKQGTLRQLFGGTTLKRGLAAGLRDGHGPGKPAGDLFQMPGVFLVDQGSIVAGHAHVQVSDRPDYRRLVAAIGLAPA